MSDNGHDDCDKAIETISGENNNGMLEHPSKGAREKESWKEVMMMMMVMMKRSRIVMIMIMRIITVMMRVIDLLAFSCLFMGVKNFPLQVKIHWQDHSSSPHKHRYEHYIGINISQIFDFHHVHC